MSEYRTCEHCGCYTNASIRACCDAGRRADSIARGGHWRCRNGLTCENCGHVLSRHRDQIHCPTASAARPPTS